MEAWKRARDLTNLVYRLSNDGAFGKDYGLRNQKRRACVSIMSNLAEGFERSGTGDFVRFLSMAKGSTGEVRCQLYVAKDQGYIGGEPCESAFQLVEQVARLIAGLLNYLKVRRKRT